MSATPAPPLGPSAALQRRLHALATNFGEKCGLARRIAVAGCLTLAAIGCQTESAAPAEPAPQVAVERPTWKPPAPPPEPTSCGVGCLRGKGNAVVRFQLHQGSYTAYIRVEGNEGLFAIGPPLNVSRNAADWTGIETFFNAESGVYPLKILATGAWTLNISKGKQSYVDG